MIYLASQLLPDASVLHDGGGIRVAGGEIAGVYRSPAAARRASRRTGERVRDLGEGVLAPGLVDAHAHLELGGLAGRLDGRKGFAAWIRAIVRLRAGLRPGDHEQAVRDGARRLLRTGTTTVGDVDASGAAPMAREVGLRSVVYREVLDAWDADRTSEALTRIRRALPAYALVCEGVSPHAPYTTSHELLAGVARVAERRRLPVAIHWAETQEEVDWLERGRGPLRALLPRSPLRSGLALIEEAGLLGPRTALIHGNHPRPGDVGRLARAGAAVVHCPGTHAFFGRAPFPWRRYERAGVPVALGTDSLASNVELDMRREMSLALRTLRGLTPERAWAMATTDAARALGLDGRVGRLRGGSAADFVIYRVDARGRANVLEALTGGAGMAAGVWVGGRSRRLA